MPGGKKQRDEQAPQAAGRVTYSRDACAAHNAIALALARAQTVEEVPGLDGRVVTDPLERERLGDRMLQDARDASFYLEECAHHLLAGRVQMALQAAEIWRGIRNRITATRALLTEVTPPPAPAGRRTYWVTLPDRTYHFDLEEPASARDDVDLELYRWLQTEAALAARSDSPVWQLGKSAPVLRPSVKGSFPRLPEALTRVAATLRPGSRPMPRVALPPRP